MRERERERQREIDRSAGLGFQARALHWFAAVGKGVGLRSRLRVQGVLGLTAASKAAPE